MSDNTPESNQDTGSDTSSETKSFSEKYSDVMGKVNETLGNVDWTQMGKYGKAAGIIAVVVIAQIIIKVVIDTINFFPIKNGFEKRIIIYNFYHILNHANMFGGSYLHQVKDYINSILNM